MASLHIFISSVPRHTRSVHIPPKPHNAREACPAGTERESDAAENVWTQSLLTLQRRPPPSWRHSRITSPGPAVGRAGHGSILGRYNI